MFSNSISRLLIVLQSSILVGLFAATAVVAVGAWRDYDAASEVLNGTKTSKALFQAMIDVRAQVGTTQTALVSESNPSAKVQQIRERAGKAFDTAIAEMSRLELEDTSGLLADLQSNRQHVKQLEGAIDAQARLPKGERDLAATEDWRVAVHETVGTISATSLAVGNQVRLLDPFVAEMVQIRLTAWTIRDRFGAQCSLLRPNVASSEPLSADMVGKWYDRIGGFQISWRALDELLARPGVPASITSGVAAAKQSTSQVLGRMMNLTTGFDGSGKPAMPAAEFTALCNGPFDSIVAIAFTALDEAVAYAEDQRGGALTVAIVSGVAMLGALALSVFAIAMVIRRFSRPIGTLMAVVDRLSRREFSEPVPAPRHPDELGQLSNALEELRQNAEEAERLRAAQQAEEQRQLERGKRLESAISGFETRVAEVVTAVQAASTEMQANAQSLSAIAEEANNQSLAVASASQQASSNVQTVAAASEELSASIGEVNQQINSSSRMAARNRVLAQQGWDVERQGLFGAPEVTVVLGAEAHASLYKVLSLLGLGRERVRRVEADGQGRLRADRLPAIAGPTIVCIQAGNVNSGAFDPAAEVVQWAQRSGAWVHVDGAFGLWALASAEHAPLAEGFREADSWATDAHKWLNVPYDCGIALVRDREALGRAMSISGAYLLASGQRDAMNVTPDSSRRARAVEVWAALKSLGRAGLSDLVGRNCGQARQMAGLLRAGGAEILNEVVLNQVVVAFGDDARTQRVVAAVQQDGTCWCGGTSWQGRAAMRISISSWATSDADIDRSAAAILDAHHAA